MNTKSLLEHAGLRATSCRLQVLETLQDSEAPLAARDVWQRLPDGATGVATVYRALSALCAAGLARKILSDHNALYESSQAEYAPQLICSRCGQVEEIKDPSLLRYNARAMKRRGLEERGNALLMYADCRRKECAGK